MTRSDDDDDKTQTHLILTKGTIVSHYRIVEKIGAGGMGEVFLAEDSQLDRKVALKFLAAHLSQDKDSRARFTREAKATARLDHPNIVPIHEVGEFNGRPFLAMAHITGLSLKEIIKRGKLSSVETVDYLKQICEGLHAAHTAGIVHRDVKPANIIIDSNNQPRILDFGLATVSGENKLTRTGSTLGTVGYMSPEQITGKDVDHRSDLFSIGIILYEMLAGRRPFVGENDAAIARSVTDSTPEPVARYKSGTTSELQLIIDKALSKDRDHRYQHADDLLADLRRERELLSDPSRSIEKVQQVKAGMTKTVLAIIAATLLFWSATLYFTYFSNQAQAPIVPSQRQISFYGDVGFCEISPDGSYFIFTRQFDSDQALYMQDFSGGEALELLRWFGFQGLRISPDGKQIAVSGYLDKTPTYGTYILPRFGGPLRQISTRMCTDLCVAWSPVSPHLAMHESCSKTHRDSISMVNLENGKISNVPLSVPFQWCYSLCWLEGGDKILAATVSAVENALWAIDLNGDPPLKVIDGKITNIRKSGRPNLVYCLSEQAEIKDLLKVSLDLSNGRQPGTPVTLMTGQQMNSFSISADNRKLLYNKQNVSSNLWRVSLKENSDTTSKTAVQLTQGTGIHRAPAISPDGDQVAYCAADGQVWVRPSLGGTARRVSFSGIRHFSPAWSPDGSQIASACTYDGKVYDLAINNISGGQARRIEVSETGNGTSISWLPGNRIICSERESHNFMIVDLGTETTTPLLDIDTPGWLFCPTVSPSGEQIAIFGNGLNASTGLWTLSLIDSAQTLICRGWTVPIGWSDDEKSILVTIPDKSDPRMSP
ncbi:MAG: protein kinase, partial [candidate division Zixibacteria bacterium]